MELKPLNIFQRCIREWDQAHPYNAAQVLCLQGTPDLAAIRQTWNHTLAALGLGVARVIGRRFRYEAPPPQEVARVGADVGLEQFISREMNRPFEELAGGAGQGSATMPFRPFVAPGAGSYHLGLFYQHWVADSVAIRMLLREWFCRLLDPAHAGTHPLHVPQGGYWRYFGPRRGGWRLASGAAAVLSSMKQFRNARRIAEDSGPHHVACSRHQLPEGMVATLLEVARRRQVTLNDLFLAALARACDEHGAAPRHSPHDLALGTIVDLRAHCAEDLDNTFGLFLGFTSVAVPAALLRDPDGLLTAIARQNTRHKETRAAQVSMLRMAAGYVQGKCLSPRRLAAFYRNYMPFSGGVSNVNMNRTWPAQYHPAPLLDYFRVAPTGPMVPVVIAATTLGQRLTFTLTRRASLVDDASAAELAQTFIEELTARAKAG